MPERQHTSSRTALIQEAAWIARCVGRGSVAPLSKVDISALAASLQSCRLQRGEVAFKTESPSVGVWIVRSGKLELAVRTGLHRAVVHILRPGDVDGDIQLLLNMPMPYTARAVEESVCLHLAPDDFEWLLERHPAIARRWMASIAERLSNSQSRIIGMLGRSLVQQAARLLLEEATNGVIAVPQETLAAMLGVRRPSLNRVLKEFEHAGLIHVRYGAVDVLDPAGLEKRG